MVRRIAALAVAGGLLSAATISIQPTTNSVESGKDVTLAVNVDNVSDLSAFQFDVAFSPVLLSAIQVMEGPLFSSSGVSFSPGFIDNTAGAITFIGDALSGPGPGVMGPGT